MQVKVHNILFHTHPWDEKRLGLDGDHVIVDRAAFVAVLKEILELRSQSSNKEGVFNGNSD